MTTSQTDDLKFVLLVFDIKRRWGVDDAAFVVARYGYELCAKVHRKLLGLARLQKLGHVTSFSGYFVQTLMQWTEPEPVDERPVYSDEFIEGYLERKRREHE